MKILSILNPSLDDYKISGAALLGINVGEYINHNIHGVEVDYVASSAIYSLLDRGDSDSHSPEVFIPSFGKKNIVRDTIEYSVKVFLENNYDVMHIHLHQMSVLSAIENIIPKDIPVVYTQHSSTILGRFSLGYRPDAYKLSSDRNRKIKIVCPSESMKRIWEEYIENSDNANNVVVIRNGINTISSESVKSLSERNGYISCGRIDPNKGMLEVAKFCVEYGHKITLVGSLGMGSMKIGESQLNYYNEFLDLVDHNSDILEWKEYVPNSVLIKMMSKARGYISMSNKESFGLTVAEAMSVGTPVLYLQENAISEITNDSSSVMIPRDKLYRKKFSSRLPVFEDCYNLLEDKINSNIVTSESVKAYFNNMQLSIGDCSRNYVELYESFSL